jgi:hypothetical protein
LPADFGCLVYFAVPPLLCIFCCMAARLDSSEEWMS